MNSPTVAYSHRLEQKSRELGFAFRREIWIAGVPFMDSLSFTFLGFASYTVALLIASPLYRRGLDLRVLDSWKIRRSPRVWLMAALFMMMVDLVVDPLSVRGDRWFLGTIFWYDPPGPHFGVPISNYLGWFFVAAISIALFHLLDGWLNRGDEKPIGAVPAFPSRALRRKRSCCMRFAIGVARGAPPFNKLAVSAVES